VQKLPKLTPDDVLSFVRDKMRSIRDEVEGNLNSPTLHSFLHNLRIASHSRPWGLIDVLRQIETSPAFVEKPALSSAHAVLQEFIEARRHAQPTVPSSVG
jgi:hypothetical protein